MSAAVQVADAVGLDDSAISPQSSSEMAAANSARLRNGGINGGVIRLNDGHRFMNRLSSHHYLLMTGRHRADLDFVTRVFGMKMEIL
jgi:hypothetical protein